MTGGGVEKPVDVRKICDGAADAITTHDPGCDHRPGGEGECDCGNLAADAEFMLGAFEPTIRRLEQQRDMALFQLAAEKADHHRLGEWFNCPTCARYYQQDEDGAALNAGLHDALRLAMGELQECITLHEARCRTDKGHEHTVYRRLLRAQQLVSEAHAEAITR